MKKLKRHILPFAVVLSLISCVLEELPIDVAPAEVQLVVSSRIHPGEPMFVLVTRSFSALEGNEDTLDADFLDLILVKNAEVVVNTENGATTLLHDEDIPGVYVSDELLEQTEGNISLIVNDTLKEMYVTATAPILNQVGLSRFVLQEEIDEDDTTQFVIYEFEDPEEDNWYVINVIDPARIFTSDESNPLDISGLVYADLISDARIEDGVFQDSTRLFELALSDTVIVFFANISEGYFRFLDAKQRSSFTGEPVNFPTNIEGGQGYFNAHTPYWEIVEKTKIEPR